MVKKVFFQVNANVFKRLSQVVLITIFIGCVISCSDSKRKKLADKTTMEFFSAVNENDTTKMWILYPALKDYVAYYKSDECVIKETKVLADKKVSVIVNSSFTNPFGKKSNQTITLFLKPDGDKEDSYKIYDSKGINDYKNDNIFYTFASKTGCIDKNADLTDQEIIQKLKIAQKMMTNYYFDTFIQLLSHVFITSWNWQLGYGGSASGNGIVKNISGFNLPKLKYTIKYFDSNGNEITTDNGYVTYDMFMSGSSKSFTFYTSYVGNARRAKIDLDFDTEMILNYVASKDYTGKEFEEYKEKMEEPKAENTEKMEKAQVFDKGKIDTLQTNKNE